MLVLIIRWYGKIFHLKVLIMKKDCLIKFSINFKESNYKFHVLNINFLYKKYSIHPFLTSNNEYFKMIWGCKVSVIFDSCTASADVRRDPRLSPDRALNRSNSRWKFDKVVDSWNNLGWNCVHWSKVESGFRQVVTSCYSLWLLVDWIGEVWWEGCSTDGASSSDRWFGSCYQG